MEVSRRPSRPSARNAHLNVGIELALLALDLFPA
jgi:hypothetical protein